MSLWYNFVVNLIQDRSREVNIWGMKSHNCLIWYNNIQKSIAVYSSDVH